MSYDNSQDSVESTTLAPDHAAGLAARVVARRADLSPTERRVAQFFVEHPEETAFEAAAEIARVLGTSDATVIRTARALGYAGLPELKRELFDDMRSRLTPAARLGRSLEWIGDDPGAALDHVLSLQIEFLEEAHRTVRPDEFRRAVALIAGAERVLTFGIGPLDPLAQYFTLKLMRFGRQAMPVTHTGFRLADALLVMRPDDVLVLLAYGRLYREIEATLAHVKRLNIPIVLVTDTLAAAVQADATLTAYCSRAGMLSTVATTIVLLDALLLGVAVSNRPRSLAAMQQLNSLRSEIVGYEHGDIGGFQADEQAARS